MNDDLISTPEAARRLGLSDHTLAIWRVQGNGPAFVKLGRRVLYRAHDLEAFVARSTRRSTSDAGTAPTAAA